MARKTSVQCRIGRFFGETNDQGHIAASTHIAQARQWPRPTWMARWSPPTREIGQWNELNVVIASKDEFLNGKTLFKFL